jgi:molybdate transport system ATP-binding protein
MDALSLALRGATTRGPLRLAVDFTVAPGETLALVGPNGAGKSTCLQLLAGLVRLETGRLELAGEALDDPATGVFVVPEARGVGYLPQDPLLFPHLSVRANVAFGPRAQRLGRAAVLALTTAALQSVGAADLAGRRPRELSGGQIQRVGLARALAARPRLLLLDEPLSAVDASARIALRHELHEHLARFAGPRLVVTHDVVDAFALADRIAVLQDGGLVQIGTAAEIGSRPRSRWVADLVGLNFLRGDVRGGVLQVDAGTSLVVASDLVGPAIATVHPRAIALFRERPSGSPRNVFAAPVVAVERSPFGCRVRLGGAMALVAEVTAAAVADLGIGPGASIWVAVKASEVQVFAA